MINHLLDLARQMNLIDLALLIDKALPAALIVFVLFTLAQFVQEMTNPKR